MSKLDDLDDAMYLLLFEEENATRTPCIRLGRPKITYQGIVHAVPL